MVSKLVRSRAGLVGPIKPGPYEKSDHPKETTAVYVLMTKKTTNLDRGCDTSSPLTPTCRLIDSFRETDTPFCLLQFEDYPTLQNPPLPPLPTQTEHRLTPQSN